MVKPADQVQDKPISDKSQRTTVPNDDMRLRSVVTYKKCIDKTEVYLLQMSQLSWLTKGVSAINVKSHNATIKL